MGSEGSSRRPFCNRCSKPSRLCLCTRLHSPPIDNAIAVTILQHSLESSHPLNSTRVARLGLKNLTVVPVTDVNFHAQLVIRPLEPNPEPNRPLDGGIRGKKAGSGDTDGVLDTPNGGLGCLSENGRCGTLDSLEKSDFLAAQIDASDELDAGVQCAKLDSEKRSDLSAALINVSHDFYSSGLRGEMDSEKRLVPPIANPADHAADKQCGDCWHQFPSGNLDFEHSLACHSCSTLNGYKEEGCSKKTLDQEVLILNDHASSVHCCNGFHRDASEMHDAVVAQAFPSCGTPKGSSKEPQERPLAESGDVNHVRESPAAEDNEITVTSDKCRITCSLRDIKITVERGVRPNISWPLSTQVTKAAILNGFMVRKVQRKQLCEAENFENFDEFDIVIPPGSAVLYPGEKSISLDAVNFEVKHLIVLDGTWGKARRMYCENPWLMLMPQLKLDSGRQSLYSEVRHEPRLGCLSTIESIVCAMKGLGGDMEGLDELLNVFESMVEDQRRCKDEKFRKLSVS